MKGTSCFSRGALWGDGGRENSYLQNRRYHENGFSVQGHVCSRVQLLLQLFAQFHIGALSEDAICEGSVLIKEKKNILWGSKGGKGTLHIPATSLCQRRGWTRGRLWGFGWMDCQRNQSTYFLVSLNLCCSLYSTSKNQFTSNTCFKETVFFQ